MACVRRTCSHSMNLLAATNTPAIRHRRKPRNPSIASRILRKYGIPACPLLHPELHKHSKRSPVSAAIFPLSSWRGFEKSELSARKLAAWLWHSQFKDASGDGDGDGGAGLEDWTLFHSSKYEFEFTTPRLNCCKEESTKWDLGLSDKSNKSTHIDSSNLLGGRKLKVEHFHAQRYTDKHKAAPKSFKEKIDQFFHLFDEEEGGMSWKEREFQKIQSILHSLKDKLARERRSRKRVELLNRSLLHELKEASLSAKQSMKKYEEEKRERERMEQLRNGLAKESAEVKANLEKLPKKLLKIHEEAEEERIMMKTSELWREEQVEMKLEDAKFVLEDRCNEMMQLIGKLESFSRSRGAELGIVEESEGKAVNVGVEGDKSTVNVTAHKEKSGSGSASGGFGQRKCKSAGVNPHVSRGTKGFVEWPQANLKTNLKPIAFEDRVRKQISQLRRMLKPNA